MTALTHSRPAGPVLRLGALGVVTSLVVLGGPAAWAAGDGVDVVNTETIQVYTDASGGVQTERVYEQVALTGTGQVELRNPIETDGLRNLDGFGGFDVDDGEQVADVSVDGETHLRTVSDYSGDLPLEISVTYLIDGEEVEPGDVVGADGDLEVRYTVRNVTARTQSVSFSDGHGGTTTKDVEVPVPMVGSLSTTLPSAFTEVASDQANIAGDGKGGTKLSFTMTLFPPLGSDTAEFGYTARVRNGVVPRAEISALPVNPLRSPTFKTAAESYQGGADTGAELTAGATEIDDNLLRLRDGAGDLLDGLLKLRAGSRDLADGLTGEAAPGARRLADGAGELDDGLGDLGDGADRLRDGLGELRGGTRDLSEGTGKLDAGAQRLHKGAKRLAEGTGKAEAGGETLATGLRQISAGLDQLADVDGLPAAQSGVTQLKAGVDQIVAGFGDPSQPTSLIGGLTALQAGLGQAETGSQQIAGGLQQLKGDGSATTPGLVGAKGGVDQVKAGLDGTLATGGSLDQLVAGLQLVQNAYCPQATVTPPSAPTCSQAVAGMLAGAADSRTNLTAASAGLGQVSSGLADAIVGLEDKLIPGTQQLAAGITEAKNGSTKLLGGAGQLKAGAQQVAAGLDQLSEGLTSAVDGVLQLSTGASAASQGSADLADGLGELDTGARRLANGSGDLADGTGELDAGATKLRAGAGKLADGSERLAAGAGRARDGSGRLAAGADELAGGLRTAADGSEQLADGNAEAAEGAPQLVDGAQRLSDEGTKQLVGAGIETAQDYGALYATMEAGAERADAESMAYGAPVGALGLTAYSYVIEGEDGQGGRNLGRGVLGAAVLVGSGGVLLLRRRLA